MLCYFTSAEPVFQPLYSLFRRDATHRLELDNNSSNNDELNPHITRQPLLHRDE